MAKKLKVIAVNGLVVLVLLFVVDQALGVLGFPSEKLWLTTDLYELQQLRSVKLLSNAFEKLKPEKDVQPVSKDKENTKEVVSKIFEE